MNTGCFNFSPPKHCLMEDKIDLVALIPIRICKYEVVPVLENVEVFKSLLVMPTFVR
jgi:hypothetical protein